MTILIRCCDLIRSLRQRIFGIICLQTHGCAQKAIKYLNEVDTFVEQFILNNRGALEEVVNNFVNINIAIRRDSYIYSMSETFESNPLWAFYANNNQGFCIEYDFNQAKKFDIDKKKMLLNTYRVIYSDDATSYSFVDVLKFILTGKKDIALLLKANLELFSQLMTKQQDWSFEKEWRIMLTNLENSKVPLNLVSRIIIDERVLKTNESKMLIELCKQRKWGVLVRKTQYINVAHKFEELA